ncbi:MAG: 2-oxoacid:acceptor oxidoreductase family protein [Candidatus Krumholzibacteria bacterium]|nr:2-oxoacid:acceptor oxidoreductase family protein [Candidatus Krumholzibacteria bacterium]
MSFRYDIRFAGAGAHGLIDAARVLAEAAAIYEDLYASESCSFGPEARGNSCRADIILSDRVIESPRVELVDFLLVLTSDAYGAYISDLKPGGLLVVDDGVETDDRAYGRLVQKISLCADGDPNLENAQANIMILGIFASACNIIGRKSLQDAIVGRAPKTLEEEYLASFEYGFGLLEGRGIQCPHRRDRDEGL